MLHLKTCNFGGGGKLKKILMSENQFEQARFPLGKNGFNLLETNMLYRHYFEIRAKYKPIFFNISALSSDVHKPGRFVS